jgi:hypothetical protein
MDVNARQTAEKITREIHIGGLIISVLRPKRSRRFVTPLGVPYEQFGLPVRGGYINCHLFAGKNYQLHGDRLWVETQVWSKTMTDGAMYLYLDLYPTQAQLTHERKVYMSPDEVPPALPPDSFRFDCYGDVQGVLVFTPRQSYMANLTKG